MSSPHKIPRLILAEALAVTYSPPELLDNLGLVPGALQPLFSILDRLQV